jgi:hypothetical protein
LRDPRRRRGRRTFISRRSASGFIDIRANTAAARELSHSKPIATSHGAGCAAARSRNPLRLAAGACIDATVVYAIRKDQRIAASNCDTNRSPLQNPLDNRTHPGRSPGGLRVAPCIGASDRSDNPTSGYIHEPNFGIARLWTAPRSGGRRTPMHRLALRKTVGRKLLGASRSGA